MFSCTACSYSSFLGIFHFLKIKSLIMYNDLTDIHPTVSFSYIYISFSTITRVSFL